MRLHFTGAKSVGGAVDPQFDDGVADGVEATLSAPGCVLLPGAIDVGRRPLGAADRAAGLTTRLGVEAPDLLGPDGAPADLGRARAAGHLVALHLPARHDARALWTAMLHAATFDLVVLARPVEPSLMAGAVSWEGAWSARTGLAAAPSVAEAIAVDLLCRLAVAAGARLWLGPLSTEAGLEAWGRWQGRVEAATAALRLHLDEDADAARPWAGGWRASPPLGSRRDREALVAAVREGALGLVADHEPWPWPALDAPRSEVPGGMAARTSAWPLAVEAVGLEVAASAWTRLGAWVPTPPAAVLFDPSGVTTPGDEDAAADPMAGIDLRGRVVGVWPRHLPRPADADGAPGR